MSPVPALDPTCWKYNRKTASSILHYTLAWVYIFLEKLSSFLRYNLHAISKNFLKLKKNYKKQAYWTKDREKLHDLKKILNNSKKNLVCCSLYSQLTSVWSLTCHPPTPKLTSKNIHSCIQWKIKVHWPTFSLRTHVK